MTPGNDTAATFRDRKAQTRAAGILIEAAPKVVQLKAKQQAKKAARTALRAA